MSYEFNPLIPDGFQKKSAVTPADIARVESEISDLQATTTDLKQKKVTKFFSANDYLEDNEIAQFQGEDDAVNDLTNGFFYKKNPAFSITPNLDTFAYNVNQKLKIYNFDGTFFEEYYLGQQNLSTSDYSVIGLNDKSIFTVCFNPALFVNPSLPATPNGNMIFYPYLNVNGVWDYTNPVSVSDGNYYYKGNRINLVTLRAGQTGASVGADMTSPYSRYLWVSILFSHYQAVFAFPYATNSNNELIALGVSNGLGAFGFQSRLTISSIAPATINVQGVTLSANQVFTTVIKTFKKTLEVIQLASDWRVVTQVKELDYWTPSNLYIPQNCQIVEIFAEFLNEDGSELASQTCCSLIKNTYQGYGVLCYSLTYPITFKLRIVAKCLLLS